MLRRTLVLLILWVAAALPAAAQTRLYTLDGRYLRVLDGDTIQTLARVDLLNYGNAAGLALAGNGSRAYVGLGGGLTFAAPGETPGPGAQPKVAVVDLFTLS